MTPLRREVVLDRLRTSLFFVPMALVLAGAGAGIGLVSLDSHLQDRAARLPFVLTTTVDGARETVSTVAQATITFAGVAFSISLLIFQLASSQYSPRVVGALFRDPFNRRVMGVVVGTFTYCLMILRSVRGPFEEGGSAVVPNLSVAVAVVLGIVSILATVAFIDHSAHSMEISSILRRVSSQTRDEVHEHRERRSDLTAVDQPVVPDPGAGHLLRFRSNGWVQSVDHERLLALAPPGGTVRLHTEPGRYAVRGAPLCTVWPEPGDHEEAESCAMETVTLGVSRTIQGDPAYGVRQLADVALKALSSGINDPTTAQDAIFHMTDVLGEVLQRDLPPLVSRDDQHRRLVREEREAHDGMVRLAYDELRRDAARQPAVCVYLLESLHLLTELLESRGLRDRAVPLREQAALVVAGADASGSLPADVMMVREAYERRFGAGTQASPCSGPATG